MIDVTDVPFDKIGRLTISTQSDIPFGKLFHMGLAAYTIYDRAVEDGYVAGICAHLEFNNNQGDCSPVMLNDAQLALTLKVFAHRGMSEHDEGLWRSSFIAGRASVFLGLVREEQLGVYA